MDKNVFEQIFTACDPESTGFVQSSKIIEFMKPYFQDKTSELMEIKHSLDQESKDNEVGASKFFSVMFEWASKIRVMNSEHLTEDSLRENEECKKFLSFHKPSNKYKNFSVLPKTALDMTSRSNNTSFSIEPNYERCIITANNTNTSVITSPTSSLLVNTSPTTTLVTTKTKITSSLQNVLDEITTPTESLQSPIPFKSPIQTEKFTFFDEHSPIVRSFKLDDSKKKNKVKKSLFSNCTDESQTKINYNLTIIDKLQIIKPEQGLNFTDNLQATIKTERNNLNKSINLLEEENVQLNQKVLNLNIEKEALMENLKAVQAKNEALLQNINKKILNLNSTKEEILKESNLQQLEIKKLNNDLNNSTEIIKLHEKEKYVLQMSIKTENDELNKSINLLEEKNLQINQKVLNLNYEKEDYIQNLKALLAENEALNTRKEELLKELELQQLKIKKLNESLNERAERINLHEKDKHDLLIKFKASKDKNLKLNEQILKIKNKCDFLEKQLEVEGLNKNKTHEKIQELKRAFEAEKTEELIEFERLALTNANKLLNLKEKLRGALTCYYKSKHMQFGNVPEMYNICKVINENLNHFDFGVSLNKSIQILEKEVDLCCNFFKELERVNEHGIFDSSENSDRQNLECLVDNMKGSDTIEEIFLQPDSSGVLSEDKEQDITESMFINNAAYIDVTQRHNTLPRSGCRKFKILKLMLAVAILFGLMYILLFSPTNASCNRVSSRRGRLFFGDSVLENIFSQFVRVEYNLPVY